MLGIVFQPGSDKRLGSKATAQEVLEFSQGCYSADSQGQATWPPAPRASLTSHWHVICTFTVTPQQRANVFCSLSIIQVVPQTKVQHLSYFYSSFPRWRPLPSTEGWSQDEIKEMDAGALGKGLATEVWINAGQAVWWNLSRWHLMSREALTGCFCEIKWSGKEAGAVAVCWASIKPQTDDSINEWR